MSYVGNSLTSHDSSLYNAQALERMTYGCGLMRKHMEHIYIYRGADKSLARTGRKQARKYFRNARDFNNIETRAVIKFFFFPARQGAEGNSRHSDRNISFFPSWSG